MTRLGVCLLGALLLTMLGLAYGATLRNTEEAKELAEKVLSRAVIGDMDGIIKSRMSGNSMASLGMKRSRNCSAVAINKDFSFSRPHAYVLCDPAASPMRSGIIVQGASQLSWLLDRYRD